MVARCTSSFLSALSLLSEKNKKHYGSCKVDICQEISGKTAESLRVDTRPLFSSPNFVTRKIRVKNSGAHIAKQGGFRVIASINKKEDEIIFLYVYPKTGPEGKGNLVPAFFKELIKDLVYEKGNNLLVNLDLDNELQVIE